MSKKLNSLIGSHYNNINRTDHHFPARNHIISPHHLLLKYAHHTNCHPPHTPCSTFHTPHSAFRPPPHRAHTRTFRSAAPTASQRPSGEKATELTALVPMGNSSVGVHVETSQN